MAGRIGVGRHAVNLRGDQGTLKADDVTGSPVRQAAGDWATVPRDHATSLQIAETNNLLDINFISELPSMSYMISF